VTVREQLRVGGIWLNTIAPWGGLSYSTRWPLGCYQASWSMHFRSTSRRNTLRAGQTVEVFVGSNRIWLGNLAQPNWRTGEFTADGWFSIADGPALNTSGGATARADNAYAGAILRGVKWLGSSGIPTTSAVGTNSTDGLNSMATVFDAVATEAGKRWGVFADGFVTMAADPTIPTWRIAPGLIDFGFDDTTFATQLVVRYLDSGTSTYTTLTVTDTEAADRFGLIEEPIDLTPYGALSAARATAKADGILALGRSRLGWSNTVDVGPYQLTTLGGIPADLSMVQAGQSVRVPMWDEMSAQPYRDLVLGQVDHRAGSQTVTIAPVDTTPKTLAEVTADLMRRARRKPISA
jgi:hypothetical protein